ncbi:MAG: hypothetical protein P4L77_00635 [Sulfuriferula sp.]|nr:hypothetical protein [Sulfuriferula sp.]
MKLSESPRSLAPGIRRNTVHMLQTGVWGLTILVFAIITGTLVAIGQPLPLLLLMGVLIGIGLMARPVTLLWVVLVGALVISGLIGLYAPSLEKVRWAVDLAAAGLGAVAIISRLTSYKAKNSKKTIRSFAPSILTWAGLFFGTSMLSSLLNTGLSADSIIGLKGYFQVWGILLAFAWLKLSKDTVDNFAKAIVPLALLQIPFALHQFLVLVPQRATLAAARELIVAPDVVVGTFVGSMTGGGGSAILAALQIATIAILLAFWRSGFISGMRVTVLSALLMVPLLFNEAKIIVVILPIALLIVFRDQMLRRPIYFILGASIIAMLLAAIFVIYTKLPGEATNTTLTEQLSQTAAYNFGQKGYGAYVLNRTSVLTYWWEQHSMNDIVQILIGHGPGITNDSGTSRINLATGRYAGMGIGLTAISALLWEVGVVGLITILGMFWSAFTAAVKLSQDARLTHWHRAAFLGLQAGIAIMAISLTHNNFFVFDIGFQALLMLMLGYTVYWQKNVNLLGDSDVREP